MPLTAPEQDLDLVETVGGWLSREEARLLMDLAGRVSAKHAIVEIGNYRGRSTTALALGSRRGAGAQVYSFDPHHEFVGPRGGRFGRADQAELYANLARTGVGEIVSVVTLDARLVAPVWPKRDVELLFVDGDHRYEAVRADHALWEPHLVPGATVAFDDCDFADVARLVQELVEARRLTLRGQLGKISWFESSRQA